MSGADGEPGQPSWPPAGGAGTRIPVWFMRQAGRSLPEYRAARGEGSMLDTVRHPELAAELTLAARPPLPRRRRHPLLGHHGAARRQRVRGGGQAGVGAGRCPTLSGRRPTWTVSGTSSPRRGRAVGRPDRPHPGRRVPGARDRLRRRAVHAGQLPGRRRAVPGPSAHQGAHVRRTPPLVVAHGAAGGHHPGVVSATRWRRGLAAVQVFDSWVGTLSPSDYRAHVLPASRRIFAGLDGLGVPRIHFGVGTGELLGLMAEAGADVHRRRLAGTARRGRPAGPGRAWPCRATWTRPCVWPPGRWWRRRPGAFLQERPAGLRAHLQPRPRGAAADRSRTPWPGWSNWCTKEVPTA